MNQIRIVLAEDHEMVREGLRRVLCAHPDLFIVGEASDGIEALAKVESLNPDVLILDLTIPRLHGLHVLTRLKSRKTPKTIILTMHSDAASAVEAVRLGARAYILKNSPSSELVAAIRSAAANGEVFVTRPLNRPVHDAAVDSVTNGNTKSSTPLTPREQMVMREVAEGKTNAEIAQSLGISARTVEKHRLNFMKKMNFRSQCELIRFAIREGIIQA